MHVGTLLELRGREMRVGMMCTLRESSVSRQHATRHWAPLASARLMPTMRDWIWASVLVPVVPSTTVKATASVSTFSDCTSIMIVVSTIKSTCSYEHVTEIEVN